MSQPTKNLSFLFAAAALIAIVQVAVAQRGDATITGSVAQQGTGLPLNQASIALIKAGESEATLQVSTNERGEFSFRNLAPGQYRLTADRPGFVRAEYGQRALTGQGIAITVAAGQVRSGVQFTLTPTATVSGRITNSRGDPVGNADVVAFKVSYREGQRNLSAVRAVRTNDLGEYRIFWLTPGPYVVGVQAPDGIVLTTMLNNIEATDSSSLFLIRRTPRSVTVLPPRSLKEDEANLLTYFPGTIEGPLARLLDLAPAADFRNIDIAVSPIQTHRVRGTVLAGNVTGSIQMRLVRIAQPPFQQYSASASSGGTFAFTGVIPGPYLLLSTGPNGLSGRMAVEVRDADVDLTVQLNPGMSLPIRVRFEDPQGETDSRLAGLRVDIVNEPWANGTFSDRRAVPVSGILNPVLPPGDYRVYVSPVLSQQTTASVPPSLQGVYVKSMELAGANVLRSGLRLERQPEGSLEIVLGSKPGNLIARTSVPGAVVVLLPEEGQRFRNDMIRTATADAAGLIRLQNLVPGDYKVFAWEDIERDAWLDSEWIKSYESRARPLRVGESSDMEVELMTLPNPILLQ